MLKGYDISDYQSSIPSGQFVIMKATEGVTWNDPDFKDRFENYHGLRGAYHFARPAVNSAIDEAKHFIEIVRAAGHKPGDMVVLDHETVGRSAAYDSQWARDWCAYVESQLGTRPVVYTYLSFAWEGRCQGLEVYPLWIADPSSAPGHPRVPAPWKSWILHQYSELGNLDHDLFFSDENAWLHLSNGKPTHATISLGSTGGDVVIAQELLNKHGANPALATDGAFGPKTEAATKEFQTRTGLVVDGIIGPKTWTELLK